MSSQSTGPVRDASDVASCVNSERSETGSRVSTISARIAPGPRTTSRLVHVARHAERAAGGVVDAERLADEPELDGDRAAACRRSARSRAAPRRDEEFARAQGTAHALALRHRSAAHISGIASVVR